MLAEYVTLDKHRLTVSVILRDEASLYNIIMYLKSEASFLSMTNAGV